MISALIAGLAWSAYGQAPLNLALSPEELVGGVAAWWEASPRGWFGTRPVEVGQGRSLGGLVETFWVGAGHTETSFSGYALTVLHRVPDLPQTALPDPDQDPSAINRPEVAGTFSVSYVLAQVGVFRNTWGAVFKGVGILGPDVRAYGGGMDLVWRYTRGTWRYGVGVENLFPLVIRWDRVYEATRPNLLAGLQAPAWPRARIALALRAYTDDQEAGSNFSLLGYGMDVSLLLTWAVSSRWPFTLLMGLDRWNPGVGGTWVWDRMAISIAYRIHLDLGGSFRWAFRYRL